MADFRFQPRDFGVGVEQRALRCMHAIAGREMRLARFFESRFGFAQRRRLRFQFNTRAFDFARCRSSVAYTLDYSGDPHQFAYQAPTIIYVTADIRGRSAHAGFEPEKGVSAVTGVHALFSFGTKIFYL